MAKQEDNDAKPASNAAASGSDEKQTQASATQSPTSGAASTQATSSKTTEAGVTTADGIELLKADHRKVEALFKDYEKAAPARKTAIIREACAELIAHTRLEEEIFYPACREAASDDEPLNEAQVEHDGAKVLIADLLASDEDDPYRDAKFKVLSEQIKHHVAEEEKPGSGIFAKARAAGVDVEALGRELRQRKEALTARGGRPRPTPLVALEISDFSQGQQQEDPMARQQGGRDRDDQGRFTSDDRGRSRGRDDEDRGYRSRGRDDDDGRGWYGDSEGHSEASRRGWAARRGGESRSFRDDDDRGGYRSRSNERDRDEYGRFVSDDDRGARSRGRDDDDDRGGRGRGHGGWFGDSEGHARAARRGWEDDDRGGSRSRGRDDDDDRGGRGRGRGQGGWFGDSEGHAEAARRGWEDRR